MYKKLFTALFALMLLISLAVPAFANSPAPAWLTVYVNEAPEDMELWLSAGDATKEPAHITDNAYDFYRPSMTGSGAKLHVRTSGREYTFDVTEQMRSNGALLTFGGDGPHLTVKASRL